VDSFLNKFAARLYKRFPPRLNIVSTLPCETQHSHNACATTELVKLQKEMLEATTN